MSVVRTTFHQLFWAGAMLVLTACTATPALLAPDATAAPVATPAPQVLIATPTPAAGLDPGELRIIEVYRRFSPALRAGVRTASQTAVLGYLRYLVGGDILTAIDGVALSSWDDLRAYLDERTEVGQTVWLSVWRNGQRLEVDVVLGQEPY